MPQPRSLAPPSDIAWRWQPKALAHAAASRGAQRVVAAASAPGARPHPRLRVAVQPAHRAARARVRRLLRDRRDTTSPPRDSPQRRPTAIILSGGPASVYAPAAPLRPGDLPPRHARAGHLLRHAAHRPSCWAARCCAAPRREYGHATLARGRTADLFRRPRRTALAVWMSHGDRGRRSCRRASRSSAGTADVPRRRHGRRAAPHLRRPVPPRGGPHAQRQGNPAQLPLRRLRLPRATGPPSRSSRSTVEQLRQTVGSERVLCASSGGVDSSVLAALLHRAIGEQLDCIFINNGLLRKNEADEVRRRVPRALGIHLHYVDATGEFLGALRGVVDPERKRRIIGDGLHPGLRASGPAARRSRGSSPRGRCIPT